MIALSKLAQCLLTLIERQQPVVQEAPPTEKKL